MSSAMRQEKVPTPGAVPREAVGLSRGDRIQLTEPSQRLQANLVPTDAAPHPVTTAVAASGPMGPGPAIDQRQPGLRPGEDHVHPGLEIRPFRRRGWGAGGSWGRAPRSSLSVPWHMRWNRPPRSSRGRFGGRTRPWKPRGWRLRSIGSGPELVRRDPRPLQGRQDRTVIPIAFSHRDLLARPGHGEGTGVACQAANALTALGRRTDNSGPPA